jgi:hypothetical protein
MGHFSGTGITRARTGSHVRKAPDPTTASVGARIDLRGIAIDAGDQGAVVIAHLETVGPRELLRRLRALAALAQESSAILKIVRFWAVLFTALCNGSILQPP